MILDWKDWWAPKLFDLTLELVGTGFDWHSSAVKAKRKETPLPHQSLISNRKLALRETEDVPKM